MREAGWSAMGGGVRHSCGEFNKCQPYGSMGECHAIGRGGETVEVPIIDGRLEMCRRDAWMLELSWGWIPWDVDWWVEFDCRFDGLL